MEMLKNLTGKQRALAIAILVVLGILGLGIANRAKAPTPSDVMATSTPSAASSTPSTGTHATSTTPVAVYTGPFKVNAADTIVSWSFKGAYTGNSTLEAQANADITKLTNLIGKGQYDDYDLYNGIANDYNLLGNGKQAYAYYDLAFKIHPNKGLAYTNLAHLFVELGAYYSAADAYAKAVAVEPGMLQYHLERLKYLTTQFPTDNARIVSALTDASKVFGDTAPILTIEAEWLEGQGRYADAIKAWQRAKMLMPGQDTTAIDAAIARDQAKLQ